MISSVVVIVYMEHVGDLQREYCRLEVFLNTRAREAIDRESVNLELQDLGNRLQIIGAGEFADVAGADNSIVAMAKKNVVINTWRALGRPNELVIIDTQDRNDLVSR